ncbi:MAG: serine hydroxymethyltransferase [Spirochaetota bacterium]
MSDELKNIMNTDKEIYDLIKKEETRQIDSIRLIPSENYVTKAVLEATGSVLTNKYSEGYPHKRYYEGQEYIDEIELLTKARAEKLFKADHANVQPYSGSPANAAMYYAFLKPGDTILAMGLPFGGHLTHGWSVSFSGITFNAIHYSTIKDGPNAGYIDYDQVRDLAKKEKPKLILCGGSAYPRIIDFKAFREIADEVGAVMVTDMAHFAGLVAGEAHPSPIPYSDAVTSTTHKTLRGPRGGMILCKEEHAKAIDKAVFPGMQGGPHNHSVAALAVALKEADTDEFKKYSKQVVANAKTLAKELKSMDYDLVSGGTDTHLLLIDLTNKGVTGKKAAKALNKAGLILNANSVPYDKRKPFSPSGIRLGSPAITSRGFKEDECKMVAKWIDEVITNYQNEEVITKVSNEVKELCKKYPAPGLAE